MSERRFPPPWTIETLDGGFKVVDSNGPRDAQVAKALTLDEARRRASNIAKLPTARQTLVLHPSSRVLQD